MGRIFLFAAAALLLATALIHAGGQPMVSEWLASLPHQQKQAMSLVWLTDSVSWAVVSAVWAIAGWRQKRDWLAASAMTALIPLAMVVGIMGIDPTFFGGWMLLGSVALAGAGLVLSWRQAAP
jgi:hypothetical protein